MMRFAVLSMVILFLSVLTMGAARASDAASAVPDTDNSDWVKQQGFVVIPKFYSAETGIFLVVDQANHRFNAGKCALARHEVWSAGPGPIELESVTSTMSDCTLIGGQWAVSTAETADAFQENWQAILSDHYNQVADAASDADAATALKGWLTVIAPDAAVLATLTKGGIRKGITRIGLGQFLQNPDIAASVANADGFDGVGLEANSDLNPAVRKLLVSLAEEAFREAMSRPLITRHAVQKNRKKRPLARTTQLARL